MAKYNVTTPAPGHNGAVGKVTFADGTAVVDESTHPNETAYFRAQGYGVEPVDTEPDVDALRAQATELGLKVHHAAKAETIQRQIDEARAAASNTETPDDEDGDDEENDR